MRRQTSLVSAAIKAAMSLTLAGAVMMGGSAEAAEAARQNAHATFTSVDASGCITTEVSVFVRALAGKGAPERARLRLRILQVDECKSVALLNIEERVTLRPGTFQIAPGLASASLGVAIPVRDRASQKRITTTLQLSWKAVEKAITAARTDEPVEPGRFQQMRQPVQRTMRMAEASGVVRANSGDLASGLAEAAWLELAVGGAPAASKRD